MKKIFKNSQFFDKRAISEFGFSELILQENASRKIADLVRKKLKLNSKILFLCGAGNNGADAIAASRMLQGDYNCKILLLFQKCNKNVKTQLNMAQKVGVKVTSQLEANKFDCIVDGIFGVGLSRDLDEKIIKIIKSVNKAKALKIAVDLPSGLDLYGNPKPICFAADYTVTMGVLKLGLFSDLAKDFVGKIKLANLGLSSDIFAHESEDYLLEFNDLKLPKRDLQNVNKGNFGHAFIFLGDMKGAAQMSALAALNMGVGRVSLVGKKFKKLDKQIMLKNNFKNAEVIAVGMGLGQKNPNYKELINKKLVIDADMFYKKEIVEFLNNKNTIITPHPKEFASLIKMLNFEKKADIDFVQKNRFELARKFSKKFPCTLVLKGANTIISQNGILYINPLGTNKLSVGGSGDVLVGIILAYLAQGFTPLNAAINGVLAHAKTAFNYKSNDYSFTPNDMIRGLKCL